jgi:hypothetical protein
VLQGLDILIQKLAGLVTYGVLSMVESNSGFSLLITNNKENTTDYALIMHCCLIYQESLCTFPQNDMCIYFKTYNFVRSF